MIASEPQSVSPASPPPLAITFFGPMQVFVEGNPLPRLRSRKSLWLLALLTLRKERAVEREWLAGALWPDVSQKQAFTNLRIVLSELRRALGSQAARIQAQGRTLAIVLDGADIDVRAFDEAAISQDPMALERAVTLYRGALLEGCAEEWVGQERNARESACLRALQTLAQSAMTVGNYEAAADYFRRAAALDPWREAAHRGLMLALSRNGEANAALETYQAFVRFLHRNDPRAAPDIETAALYARLRAEARRRASAPPPAAAEQALLPSVTGCLPHPLTTLIGRDDDREEVVERLQRSRLVTLTGPGGIGKTRLAIEVAREVVRDFPDGVWMIALEALSEGRLIAGQMASVIGVKEERDRTSLQSVIDSVRSKRLLLVLDNCEHLHQASVEVVGSLLTECAQVQVLATSREALGIVGETVWTVPPLAVPDLAAGAVTPARELAGYGGVQLFVERAESASKMFAVAGGNASAVAEICIRLDGIPLAIELAAVRVRALTAPQIAAMLGDHLNLLTQGSRIAPSRHRTLRATLDWSYELLSGAERLLLAKLSVFAGGWDLAAASDVCGGGGAAGVRVLDLLTSLIDKSLLIFEKYGEEQTGRYRMLETVRQYAAERLQDSGEAERVRSRHWNWCFALAEKNVPRLRDSLEAIQRLKTEHDNLRAALAWGAADPERAEENLRLAGRLWPFYFRSGHYSEGRALLQRALESAGAQGRTAVHASVLHGAGELAFHQSDYASAQRFAEESLSISRERNDKHAIALSLNRLGSLECRRYDYLSSRALFEESLALSRELNNQVLIATCLSELGNLTLLQHDWEAAQGFYEESLRLRRDLGNKVDIALSLGNLGNVIHQRWDYISAKLLLEESLNLRRELEDIRGIVWALGALGHLVHALGEYERARALYEESLILSKKLGGRSSMAWSLVGLGNAVHALGEHEKALSFFEESLSISRDLDDRRAIASSLRGLASIAYVRNDYAAASELCEDSLRIWKELGDREEVMACLEVFAAVLLAQGHSQASVHLWGALHTLRTDIGKPMNVRDQERLEQFKDQVYGELGAEKFAAAWDEGRGLTWEQAAEYAQASSIQVQ